MLYVAGAVVLAPGTEAWHGMREWLANGSWVRYAAELGPAAYLTSCCGASTAKGGRRCRPPSGAVFHRRKVGPCLSTGWPAVGCVPCDPVPTKAIGRQWNWRHNVVSGRV